LKDARRFTPVQDSSVKSERNSGEISRRDASDDAEAENDPPDLPLGGSHHHRREVKAGALTMRRVQGVMGFDGNIVLLRVAVAKFLVSLDAHGRHPSRTTRVRFDDEPNDIGAMFHNFIAEAIRMDLI
jgi:hypothetical protein